MSEESHCFGEELSYRDLCLRSDALVRLDGEVQVSFKYLDCQPYSLGFVVTVEDLEQECESWRAQPVDKRDDIADSFFDEQGQTLLCNCVVVQFFFV